MEWIAALPWGKIAGGLGVAGLLAGVSNALIAYWLAQQKDRTSYRRVKIKEWRSEVQRWEWSELAGSAAYSEMRQHIRPEVVRDVENDRLMIVPGGRGGDPRTHILLDEIARIERQWGLI